MARRSALLLVVAAAVASAAVPASAVASVPRIVGSGTFAETSSTVVSAREVGGVTYLVLDNVVDWYGPISGEAQETLAITVKPTGDSQFRGVDVFPDSTTLRFVGVDSGGAFHGVWTAAGPDGFSGHGSFAGFDACENDLPCGTYAGGFLS